MHASRSIRSVLALAGLLLAPVVASAQDVAWNGNFDHHMALWSVLGGGTATFDPTQDADQHLNSGSVALTNPVRSPKRAVALSYCIYLPALNVRYRVGAKVRFPAGVVAVRARLVAAVGQDVCDGPIGFSLVEWTSPQDGSGVWLPLATTAMATGRGQFIQIRVDVENLTGGPVFRNAPVTVNIDQVFAAPETTPFCRGLPATIIAKPEGGDLTGSTQRDVIVGLEGDDIIDGRGGNDVVCGGDGNDTLLGGKGFDDLDGGRGDDDLNGGPGGDVLVGGGGDDQLVGGPGSDVMYGGPGFDVCRGGSGTDTVAGGCDRIPQ